MAGIFQSKAQATYTHHFGWSHTLYKDHKRIQPIPSQGFNFSMFSSEQCYKAHLNGWFFMHVLLLLWINSSSMLFLRPYGSAERLSHFTLSQSIFDKPRFPTPRPTMSYGPLSALPITQAKKISFHHFTLSLWVCWRLNVSSSFTSLNHLSKQNAGPLHLAWSPGACEHNKLS